MKAALLMLGFALAVLGCANICEFGSAGTGKNVRCYGLMDSAEKGMTQKEVEKKIGLPDRRIFGISYMGKKYDEAWVYSNMPTANTVLYFQNGILKEKDYEQYKGY